jgi:hypothetical protein
MAFPKRRNSLRRDTNALAWIVDLAQTNAAEARRLAGAFSQWLDATVGDDGALETLRLAHTVPRTLGAAEARRLQATLRRLLADPILRGSGRVPAPERLNGLELRLAGWTRPSVDHLARALGRGRRRMPRLGPAHAIVEISGPVPTVVTYLAYRLLERVGVDHIRRCAACPKLFVAQRADRTTCSARCYLRVYMKEYRRAGYRGTRLAKRRKKGKVRAQR